MASLSDDEHEWLAEHPAVRVSGDPDYPPLDYYDAGGTYRGVSADLLNLVAERTGLRFVIARSASWAEALRRVEARDVDMLTGCTPTATEPYLILTGSYIDLPLAIVGRTGGAEALTLGRLNGLRVAAVPGYEIHEMIAASSPRALFVDVPDIPAGLHAVALGEADVMVDSLASVSYHTERDGITNLRVVGHSETTYPCCLGVRSDWPVLRRIVQKGLDAISEADLRALRGRRMSLGSEPKWYERVGARGLVLLGVAAVLLSLVGVVVWNRSLHRLVTQRTGKLTKELAEGERAVATQRRLREVTAALGRTSRRVEAVGLVLDAATSVPGVGSAGIYVTAPGDSVLVLAQFRGPEEQFPPFLDLPAAGRDSAGVEGAVPPPPIEGLIPLPDQRGRVSAVLRLGALALEALPESSWAELETLAAQLGGALARIEAAASEAESRRNLQAVFDAIDDMVFVLDPSGRILAANRAAAQRLGFTEDQLAGSSVVAIHPPDRAAEARATLMAMASGGTDCSFVPLRTRDGRDVPVETRVAHGRWNGREVLFGVSRDISAQLRTDDERRRRQGYTRLLQLAAKAANEAVSVREAFATVIEGLCRGSVWGLGTALLRSQGDRGKLLPTGIRHVGEADDLAAFASALDSYPWTTATPAIAHLIGQRYPAYFRLDDPQAPDIPMGREAAAAGLRGCITVPVLCAEETEGVVLLGSLEDAEPDSEFLSLLADIGLQLGRVVERERSAERLQRLATAIEQSGESVVITDADRRIVYVNSAFEGTTGYSRAEVLGLTPTVLSSGEQGAVFYAELWETISHGATWRGRFINRRKGGEVYTEDAVISPVFDSDGVITHYVSVTRDVTESLRLEEQLRRSQRMEAIGRLAGGIAHDFNNLLQIMVGASEMALDSVGSAAPAAEWIEQVIGAGDRGASLVRQLLAFSRRQVLELVTIGVNGLVDELLSMVGRVIGEHIRLELIPGPDEAYVHVDRAQVEQVLLNLCVNARDAMPEGGTLTITTRIVELSNADLHTHDRIEPGVFVAIAVTDTGHGMDEETLSRLFEPFFTTKEFGSGTGLGLATSYGTVRQHGGLIRAESTPGEGTTFYVYLPLAAASGPPATPEAPSRLPLGGTGTILVSEDDEAVRELVAGVLSEHGYTVVAASDGALGLEAFRTAEPGIDMLVLDMVMPRMSGRRLLEEVRRTHPVMPCLFLTGYSPEAADASLADDPRVGVLRKPFAIDDLLRATRELMGGPG